MKVYSIVVVWCWGIKDSLGNLEVDVNIYGNLVIDEFCILN